MRVHELQTTLLPPKRMNNPFGYEPHPLCLLATEEVRREVIRHADWMAEVELGKMLGVLVVETPGRHLGYLAAYSGQLCARSDWDFFVPAVFDYLQPDGYFKREEACISDINRRVREMENSLEMREAENALTQAQTVMATEVEAYKNQMVAAKQRRDHIRQTSSEVDQESLLRESQFMKAELHRLKKRHQEKVAACSDQLRRLRQQTQALCEERSRRSDALQKWLFSQFVMCNAQGEHRSLPDIFRDTPQGVPPSGAGECCAPRLLQYAYQHHLRPLCMAEFWWGQSPVGEVRHHGHYYPACRGKCLPILQFMLQGLDVDPAVAPIPQEATPAIIYEDEWLLVVNKPAGMLSVPGKVEAGSVWTFAREHCPEADGPLIVHRLDMATSGLMVLAKNKETHRLLQKQFLQREVSKTYMAVLDGKVGEGVAQKGVIRLPLRPDLNDRPRQMVDPVNGKKAVTEYEIVGTDTSGLSVVRLHPLTGRTHQLRVHCAHQQGLGCPILGDTLYGHPADRLYLHAARLSFTHPATGEQVSFYVDWQPK